jgi:DNA-directed RNA polymerase subunit RPC12/RpoP
MTAAPARVACAACGARMAPDWDAQAPHLCRDCEHDRLSDPRPSGDLVACPACDRVGIPARIRELDCPHH